MLHVSSSWTDPNLLVLVCMTHLFQHTPNEIDPHRTPQSCAISVTFALVVISADLLFLLLLNFSAFCALHLLTVSRVISVTPQCRAMQLTVLASLAFFEHTWIFFTATHLQLRENPALFFNPNPVVADPFSRQCVLAFITKHTHCTAPGGTHQVQLAASSQTSTGRKLISSESEGEEQPQRSKLMSETVSLFEVSSPHVRD